jgi:mono/diheme cytochrome c family protein
VNYPIWALPASGLLIAFVAIVHVFISHFAVGGGLFLVVTERKARREGDAELMAFVRRHTQFFVLLTLVLGAMTGVGIWFTIGLVHPQATASLINAFVWGWAIEWTFFVVEIAAAMVYYYGWDRLAPKTHELVGWIYFVAAWLSLVVINGILSFMLTPGDWLVTKSFWDGILNPTYLPSMIARTAAAMGLAGLYALLTAARMDDASLKHKVARYATISWVLPMSVALPLSLLWFLKAASDAGVPVAEVLGAPGDGLRGIVGALFAGSSSGHPIAQAALRTALIASVCGLALSLVVLIRSRSYGRPTVAALMACAFVALGAGEWLREDLRKPYVIGRYMFVNGVRAPDPTGLRMLTAVEDPFTITALERTGVLEAARWTRLPADTDAMPADARMLAEGEETFRLLCSSCHTIDGYLGLRPLVAASSPAALRSMVGRLAEPGGGGWTDPHAPLATWRGRRMPPFVGTPGERDALAAYLAVVGGAPAAGIAEAARPAAGTAGAVVFEEHCSMCHGADGFPIAPKGRTSAEFFDLIGRLPSINEAMPAFEGTEEQRRALASRLAALPEPPAKEGGR